MALRTILFLKSLKIHGSQQNMHVTNKVRGILLVSSHTNIDGSKGGRDTCLPLGPISFIFMQVSAKILPNNRPQTQRLVPPPPSGKSWIRHGSETVYDKSTSTAADFYSRTANLKYICVRIRHSTQNW